MKVVICGSRIRRTERKWRIALADLLNSSDEDGEGPAHDEFDETEEGGTIDINQEIDDGFHCSQGKDESCPSAV